VDEAGSGVADQAAVAVTLIAAVIAFAVQQTSIGPSVHDVQKSLGGSSEWSSWLVTVYLIVATLATMSVGDWAIFTGVGDCYRSGSVSSLWRRSPARSRRTCRS
jgi:hypothetical protein